MRTYEKTHPWITFKLDIGKASPKLWMLLGEAQSKCEHISGVPLAPVIARSLHNIYLAKGVNATTAIEGNSLTEDQVLQNIEKNLVVPPSQQYLKQEIDNVIKAVNIITTRLIHVGNKGISVKDIKEYNKIILKDLKLEDGIIAGEIPRANVIVGNIYKGSPREDCEYLLDKFCTWLNSEDFRPQEEYKGFEMAFGIIKAIVAHLYFVWIHPFGDGNGRTARLIEFQILLSAGLPTPSTHLLSNHYNLTRSEYYRQLTRSSKPPYKITDFIEYALQGMVDQLMQQLDTIRESQLEAAWRDYINERFKNKREPDIRRRDLLLVLPITDYVSYNEVRNIIKHNPLLSEAYSKVTDKTFVRDIRKLERDELIIKEEELVSDDAVIKTKESIRANIEKILAFLPPKAKKS